MERQMGDGWGDGAIRLSIHTPLRSPVSLFTYISLPCHPIHPSIRLSIHTPLRSLVSLLPYISLPRHPIHPTHPSLYSYSPPLLRSPFPIFLSTLSPHPSVHVFLRSYCPSSLPPFALLLAFLFPSPLLHVYL